MEDGVTVDKAVGLHLVTTLVLKSEWSLWEVTEAVDVYGSYRVEIGPANGAIFPPLLQLAVVEFAQ